jgi:hypothetical protein
MELVWIKAAMGNLLFLFLNVAEQRIRRGAKAEKKVGCAGHFISKYLKKKKLSDQNATGFFSSPLSHGYGSAHGVSPVTGTPSRDGMD